VNGCANGVRKIIWAHGTAGTTSIEFGVVGTVSGWVLNFRAQNAGSNRYEVNSSVISNDAGPDFGMMTVQQPGDSTGPRLYWNGVDVTGSVLVGTEPNRWISNYGDSATQRWGGIMGSSSVNNWQPGHLHDVIQTTRPMTGAQLVALWNAYNGVVVPVPPYPESLVTIGWTGAGLDIWGFEVPAGPNGGLGSYSGDQVYGKDVLAIHNQTLSSFDDWFVVIGGAPLQTHFRQIEIFYDNGLSFILATASATLFFSPAGYSGLGAQQWVWENVGGNLWEGQSGNIREVIFT